MSKGVKWYKNYTEGEYREDKAYYCAHGEKIYVVGYEWYQRNKAHLGFRYRYDPVPFTGISRDHHCGYLKRPRTTQERRIACGHMSEGIHVRGRRRKNSLPEYWDDYVITDRACKNWKHQSRKRTQWMKYRHSKNE